MVKVVSTVADDVDLIWLKLLVSGGDNLLRLKVVVEEENGSEIGWFWVLEKSEVVDGLSEVWMIKVLTIFFRV